MKRIIEEIVLDELPLYGSDRMGALKPGTVVKRTVTERPRQRNENLVQRDLIFTQVMYDSPLTQDGNPENNLGEMVTIKNAANSEKLLK